MRIAIHQPNYIPWLGYFRKIALSDVFVFFDNVQMPGGKSYVSRNEIRTPNGRLWLTVPVSGKGGLIADAQIADQRWQHKHLRTLEVNYGRSPWRALIRDELAPIMEAKHTTIANLNCVLIERISSLLGISHVRFERGGKMDLTTTGATSIIEILKKLGATDYLTGSGAGSLRHLDIDELGRLSIATTFVSGDFLQYEQLHRSFENNLSVLDALLSIGPKATRALLYANN